MVGHGPAVGTDECVRVCTMMKPDRMKKADTAVEPDSTVQPGSASGNSEWLKLCMSIHTASTPRRPVRMGMAGREERVEEDSEEEEEEEEEEEGVKGVGEWLAMSTLCMEEEGVSSEAEPSTWKEVGEESSPMMDVGDEVTVCEE